MILVLGLTKAEPAGCKKRTGVCELAKANTTCMETGHHHITSYNVSYKLYANNNDKSLNFKGVRMIVGFVSQSTR